MSLRTFAQPVYSELCETSLKAYTRYLQACVRVNGDYLGLGDGVTQVSYERSPRLDAGECGLVGDKCRGTVGGQRDTCGVDTSVNEISGVRAIGSMDHGRPVWVGVGRSSSGSEGVEAAGSSVGDESTRVGVVSEVGEKLTRGKNYSHNQAKRRRAKAARMQKPWRTDGGGGCVSDESVVGTVRTVDTRTAVEIQAAQTLAARRVAENDRAVVEARVAKKLAEHRLVALEDASRTDAVERLAVARMESRINREKLSSQIAYEKIDKSLKSSLGSAGSAGEFALKKQVKLGAEHKIRSEYLQEQVNKMLPLMPAHVRDAIAAMAPPDIPSDEEIFGDCPADWPAHVQEEYYEEQRRHDEELAVECADYRVVIDDGGMDYEKIRRELDACL